jgi:hypothetical protein
MHKIEDLKNQSTSEKLTLRNELELELKGHVDFLDGE